MVGFELGGPAALIAISLPLATMATLIAILVLLQRRRARSADVERPVIGRYGRAVSPPVAAASLAASRPRESALSLSRQPVSAAPARAPVTMPEPVAQRTPAQAPSTVAATTVVAPVQAADTADLAVRVARAEQQKDERRLPALYLALGEARLAAGSTTEGADLLRKSIRAAVRGGDIEVHAKARLELGDLARASGDLTTACEHWQIARGLYFEARRSAELQGVEGRMQRHGCPTDWVLNDF